MGYPYEEEPDEDELDDFETEVKILHWTLEHEALQRKMKIMNQ